MPRGAKLPDSATKRMVKEMLAIAGGVTVKEAYEKRAAMYPEEKLTTLQNVSGKLQADTTPFLEVVQLAQANGLRIEWVAVDEETPKQNSQPHEVADSIPSSSDGLKVVKIADDEQDTDDKVYTAASEGLAVVETQRQNYIIVGKHADQAADYLRQNLTDDFTKEQILFLVWQIMQKFPAVQVTFLANDNQA